MTVPRWFLIPLMVGGAAALAPYVTIEIDGIRHAVGTGADPRAINRRAHLATFLRPHRMVAARLRETRLGVAARLRVTVRLRGRSSRRLETSC